MVPLLCHFLWVKLGQNVWEPEEKHFKKGQPCWNPQVFCDRSVTIHLPSLLVKIVRFCPKNGGDFNRRMNKTCDFNLEVGTNLSFPPKNKTQTKTLISKASFWDFPMIFPGNFDAISQLRYLFQGHGLALRDDFGQLADALAGSHGVPWKRAM